ncbi:hypothetical protein KAT72_04570 [Aeromonas popoffii]|uniref:Uncharacterized protein n=1 Tax=Aeromonas popoffii TaxID=70856 RepID=A0ABS5GMF6_9GAMM|nr:hypothetical protein [Aeromonas popoffii]MBR7628329.1 hypothetical protein [Aeromonas popoffii]
MPRGAGSAYLYYLDMSEFKKRLEKMSGEGRYFSLLGVAIVVAEPSHGSGDLTRRLTVTSWKSWGPSGRSNGIWSWGPDKKGQKDGGDLRRPR